LRRFPVSGLIGESESGVCLKVEVHLKAECQFSASASGLQFEVIRRAACPLRPARFCERNGFDPVAPASPTLSGLTIYYDPFL
jgi:hypothetical protein